MDRMDGHEPATKQDLADVETRLRQEMTAVESRANERHEMLRSELHHAFDHLREDMRDIQTELLKAFYSFTESNQQRSSQIEGNQAA